MSELAFILRLLAGSRRRAFASLLLTAAAARVMQDQDRRYAQLLAEQRDASQEPSAA